VTSLTQRLGEVGHLLSLHGPSAVVSIVVAELFYKFHSFTLECLAFLVTWYVVDLLIERPLATLRGRAGRGAGAS
jgi:hypothetical protein